MSHHHGAGGVRARDEFGSDPVVVAYGAGVDSTALLIGLRDRGVGISLIMFADTGSEKPETLAYLPIMDSWLQRQGMPLIHRVKRRSPRAGDTSLHAERLRKRVLPSLAYGGHSCSLKWKADPQWAFTRDFFGWDRRQQRWPHGPTIRKLIGYDASPADARRIANATGKWPPGHRYRYPLMEWGWTRDRCEQVILAEGLPLPMKSACWMCPASKKHEVDWLSATHPQLAALSVEMERRAHQRGLTSTQGLGRRWSCPGPSIWVTAIRVRRTAPPGHDPDPSFAADLPLRAGRGKGPLPKSSSPALPAAPWPRPPRSGLPDRSSERRSRKEVATMPDTQTATADERKAAIEQALAQHSGSLERFRHWTKRIIYTPGVADMAEICSAYWLIDLVASHQITRSVRAEEFQVWTLTVAADRTALAISDDGNGHEIARQVIEFTDFSLDEIKLYLDQGTLMLPGEY